MSFNSNIPKPLDFMRDSQPLMLQNFTEISNFIGQDHFNFGDPNQGKHQWSTYINRNVNNVTNNDPNSVVFFNGTSPVNNIISLFIRDAENNLKEFTGFGITVNPYQGFVVLPSGLVIKWLLTNLNISIGANQGGQRTFTVVWPTGNNTRTFNHQFLAIAIPTSSEDFSSTNGAPVTLCLNPITTVTQVIFDIWLTAAFNNTFSIGRININQDVLIIGLGD